jgi:hypothetical protein
MTSTVTTLRRRSRLLVVAALVGLVAGVAYVLAEPPPLTSTTLVLLPTPALAGTSSSDVDTQVHIALSATILQQAGRAVVPSLPARKVEKMVKVSAPTNQLIQIDATSTDAARAQVISQAIADAYVSYVSDTAREVSAAALADLNLRKDELQRQVEQLQHEITATIKRQRTVDPNSPEANGEARLLAGLRTEQANLALQLDKVEDKIATGTPLGSGASAGTSVIQHATEAKGPSTVVRLLVWAPLGAVVLTILAAAALLAAALRDQSVRVRDEIADAVGSPVLAAVRSKPQRSVAGWSTLLETYEPTPVESWAFRRVLRRLAPTDSNGESRTAGRVHRPHSLTVISFSGDGRGLAIGPQIAAFAASLGIATRLITAMGQERAAALWAACAAEREPRPNLYVGDPPDGEAIDLSITLAVVERRDPKLGGAPARAATILAVAAGAATAQELARVALAVDDTGRRIDGIVVADPDQTDRTSGRHTMDERTRRPTLPTRLTGITASDGTTTARNRSRA